MQKKKKVPGQAVTGKPIKKPKHPQNHVTETFNFHKALLCPGAPLVTHQNHNYIKDMEN